MLDYQRCKGYLERAYLYRGYTVYMGFKILNGNIPPMGFGRFQFKGDMNVE